MYRILDYLFLLDRQILSPFNATIKFKIRHIKFKIFRFYKIVVLIWPLIQNLYSLYGLKSLRSGSVQIRFDPVWFIRVRFECVHSIRVRH